MVGGYECRIHYQETGGTGVCVYCRLHYWGKRRMGGGWLCVSATLRRNGKNGGGGPVCSLHYRGKRETGGGGSLCSLHYREMGGTRVGGSVCSLVYTIGEWEGRGWVDGWVGGYVCRLY